MYVLIVKNNKGENAATTDYKFWHGSSSFWICSGLHASSDEIQDLRPLPEQAIDGNRNHSNHHRRFLHHLQQRLYLGEGHWLRHQWSGQRRSWHLVWNTGRS